LEWQQLLSRRGAKGSLGRTSRTSAYKHPVDQRLVSFECILLQQSLPVVTQLNELVFEEVNEGSLILFLAEKVSPIIFRDFGWWIMPWLHVLRLIIVDIIEVLGCRWKEIRRSQELVDNQSDTRIKTFEDVWERFTHKTSDKDLNSNVHVAYDCGSAIHCK